LASDIDAAVGAPRFGTASFSAAHFQRWLSFFSHSPTTRCMPTARGIKPQAA
jgi:hypothetical protein